MRVTVGCLCSRNLKTVNNPVPSTTTLHEQVTQAVRTLGVRFEPAELAYYAVTSKSENHLRDRIAWSLHQCGLFATREWRRVDLAILDPDSGTASALLEAKLMWTFDAEAIGTADSPGAYPTDYQQLMKRDLDKMDDLIAEHGTASTARYCLLFSVHPDGELGPDFENLSTRSYVRRHNTSWKTYGPEMRDKLNAKVREAFAGWERAQEFEYAPGVIRGVEVRVDAWLVGPCAPGPTQD